MLADDHRPFQYMVECLLAPTYEIVESVPDGRALVEAVKRLKPDLIVTDISMPILSGIEASNQLTAWGSTAKVIFLTVHSDDDFVQTCLAVGAAGYVLKSRIMSDLLHAIEEALAGRVFISPPLSGEAAS